MAAPTFGFYANTNTENSPTWTEVLAADQFRPTGSGSSDGDLKNLSRPTTGFYVAHEMWTDDPTTDWQHTVYDGGGGSVADYTTDIFPTNPTNTNVYAIRVTINPETQAGQLEAWDDTNYNTVAKEALAGVEGGGANYTSHSFLRATQTKSGVGIGQTASGALPTGYASQSANNRTWMIRGNAIGSRITFGSILAVGSQNIFTMHFGLPASAVRGSASGASFQLAYRGFYT